MKLSVHSCYSFMFFWELISCGHPHYTFCLDVNNLTFLCKMVVLYVCCTNLPSGSKFLETNYGSFDKTFRGCFLVEKVSCDVKVNNFKCFVFVVLLMLLKLS